jgi:hypothetical protein
VNATPANDNCKTYDNGPNFGGWQTRIECQTSAECGVGQSCCATRIQIGLNKFYYSDVKCQNDCAWPDVKLCDPNNPSSMCPVVGQVQTTCQPSTLLPPGYSVCSPP